MEIHSAERFPCHDVIMYDFIIGLISLGMQYDPVGCISITITSKLVPIVENSMILQQPGGHTM